MKLNITSITRTPRTSTSGKPFTSVTLKAKEYGEKFISGFGNKANEGWKVGDEVEVEITEKPSVNKKGENVVYLNFSMPEKSAGFDAKLLSEIANRQISHGLLLQKIWDKLENKPKPAPVISGTDIPYPVMKKEPNFTPAQADSEDINPAEIPF
jgi:hypothetical protein